MRQFYLPTRVVTGTGCFAELGTHAAQLGQRAIVVCGAGSLRASGNLDRALQALRDAAVEPVLYDAVSGEPTLEMVQAGLDLAREREVALAIGIGGGSAVDVAKAIAGLYSHPGTVDDYFAGARQVSAASSNQ